MFDTSLSSELEIAAKAFNLSDLDIWQLSYNTVDHIFATEEVKTRLRQKLEDFKAEYFKQ